MFTPIRKELFRWGTPDPESDWMMFGHVLLSHNGCIIFDPPLIPGLIDAISRLGKPKSVILTTLDHTRGAAYIVHKTGADLYLPDQDPSDVNPIAFNIKKEVKDFWTYSEGKILELDAFRLKVRENYDIGMPSMNEFAVLTDHKELIVGDFVSASTEGRILVAPEWFPSDKPLSPYPEGRKEFRMLAEKTGAKSLLTSHGNYVMGYLQEEVRKLLFF